MPTILRSGPYRIYFFSHEGGEPAHVHVDRAECSAKFWIGQVSLARNVGFRPAELRRVQRLVEQEREVLVQAWHGYFGTGGR